MKEIIKIIKPVAPTLASALNGPFAGVAAEFIKKNIIDKNKGGNTDFETLFKDSDNLLKLNDIDKKFKLEMERLNADIFLLETKKDKGQQVKTQRRASPQLIISVLFLSIYFLMLAAMFFVEVSDTINMQKGENSLMDELQILFGVLTAGISQILSFWFGIMVRNMDSDIEI